jgi:hypothetical protein
VQATIHPRSIINGVSHVFEVFKDDYWSRKLRNPLDHFPRHFVQTVVNVVLFFSLRDCLERGLPGFLHPFALGETRMALFFHRWILEHNRVFHRATSTHRSERNTILVHINANNRVCIDFPSDSVIFVCNRNMKSPLAVLVDDFGRSNPPLLVSERGSEAVEMVGTATKFTFDMGTSRGSDTESNRPIVFREQPVAFPVVHHHRVRPVNVWVWATPPIIFVVVVGFDFTECFVNDELAGVFDVGSVVNDS